MPRSLRNWIKAPRISSRWVLDELKHRIGRDVSKEIRPGWSLKCHPVAFRAAYQVLSGDPEQSAELDSFISACTPGMLLFDIGAHFGVFSLAALHYGGAESRAVAVDPSPMAIKMLAVQARLNGVTERLSAVHAAAAEKPGAAEFVSVGVLAAGYFTAPEKHHGKKELTTVRTVTVDQLADRQARSPTHLKIDVEGFETGVLRGARAVLSARPAPLVFLEMHNSMMFGRGLDCTEPLNLLEDAGYRIFSLGASPITREHILSRSLIRVTARKAEATEGVD